LVRRHGTTSTPTHPWTGAGGDYRIEGEGRDPSPVGEEEAVKTRAAVVYEPGKPIEIEELNLDGPKEGEVLIRYTHAGLCHSDVHVAHGDLEARLPMVLGHEGAGIIEEVGPGVSRVQTGDHVVCSFIPNCGTCRWCATGQQAICDMGAAILEGSLPGPRFPLTGPKGEYGAMCMLGTFSQYGTVHQNSVVKVDDDLPLEKAVLVGCGVPTGWGSAVYAADVRPGETVVIYGIGGIGINAVQGAAYAGAKNVIAVDPLENKREKAMELGATHAVGTAEEAQQLAVQLTRGVGADKAILTVDLMTAEVVGHAFNAIGKGGTIVLVGLNKLAEPTIQLPGTILTLFKKTVKGTLFGDCNPTTDIPKILGLYQSGDIKLDEIITRTYTLDQVNEGYEDLLAGKNVRGVVVHEHSAA
jgi:alcohol dehydrogenase (nicotinoprotein)